MATDDVYRIPTEYADGTAGPPIVYLTREDVDRYRRAAGLIEPEEVAR